MSPDLERLIELQRIESAIAGAKVVIASHPQRLADADARLGHATSAVDDVKLRIKSSQEARREAEKSAAVYQARLTKFKDQLSEVKTNREYQAMQHEIATAQTDLGVAEEKVLERMLEADALGVELKQAEAELAKQTRAIEAEKIALAEELKTTESTLSTARSARAHLVSVLEPRLLSMFEQVARVRKGAAVSIVTRDGLCSLCHVRLRPAVFQQVRQNDSIIQCDSCQRIMHYVPPPPAVEPPVVQPA
jgi:predicted  nucleic acid-binding Zn-ribbon protein